MLRRTWVKGAWATAMGAIPAAATQTTLDAGEPIETVLRPILAEYGLPALGAAVVREGRIVASGAVGTRRVGTDNPARVTDRFHIGSDTKAMTVLLAAMQIEAGTLRWDMRLEEALPDLAGTMDPALRGATLTQLMSHTSGLPNDDEAPELEQVMNQAMLQPGNMDAQRYWLLEQVVPHKLPRAPGTGWAYSNIGYVMLGCIVERHGGATWEELMAQRVFAPLGLASAGFGPQSRVGFVDAPLGHAIVDGKPFAFLAGPNGDNPIVIGPAGTVHLSLLEFASWAGWQAGEGKRGPHLVSPETMQRMHRRVVDMPKQEGAATGTPGSVAAKDMGYALGWGLVTLPYSRTEFVFHGGSNGKNYALIQLQPGFDFAMVLTTNIVVPKVDEALRKLGAALYASYGPR